MSDERQFLENLLGQRFNFFLVFVGLVAAGFVATDQPYVGLAILTVGACISSILLLTLERAQLKLGIILEILYNEPTHPAAVVNNLAQIRSAQNRLASLLAGRSRNALIGTLIPRVLTLVLWTASLIHTARLIVA